MLTMYQLWLDDLYPRAKFADGLEIIEKLGHTKHLQIYRKEWLNGSKPKKGSDSESEVDDEEQSAAVETIERSTEQMEGLQLEEGNESIPQEQVQETPAMDQDQPMDDGNPDEDELDALLAESAGPSNAAASSIPPQRNAAVEDDPFADEMEAMAEMEDMW